MSKDPEADYNAALQLKNDGNAAFKKQDLSGALKNYSRIFMYLGMNPCMNMSAVMGGADPSQGGDNKAKDPLEAKTDELRLTAFNNIAAVYARQEKWTECLEKCERVLKHDANNQKALFRRAKSHRHLNNFEKARDDLKKLRELQGDKVDKGVILEEKLVKKGEKQQEKQFFKQMQKAMAKQQKKNKKKSKPKKEASNSNTNANEPSSSPVKQESLQSTSNNAPPQEPPSEEPKPSVEEKPQPPPTAAADGNQNTLISIPPPDVPKDNNNHDQDFVPMQF